MNTTSNSKDVDRRGAAPPRAWRARECGTYAPIMKGPAVRAAVLAIVLAATAGVTLAADPPPRIDWSSEVGYSYDGSGNITAIGPQSFTYDAGSRLVQEVLPDGSIRSYRYDGFGNRTGCADGSGVPCLASEGGTQGTNRNRAAAAVYDLTGNVTGFNGHSFTYDVLNMMTSDESPSGVRRDFVYTADDQRIAVFHQAVPGAGWWRWTVRDLSGKVLREFTANGVGLDVVPVWEKDYVWRDGKLLATLQREVPSGPVTTYRYHLDHLGTPRRITKDAATTNEVVGVHDYFAYGSETGGGKNETSLTRMKFTGHERDVVDGEPDPLDYMQARYYAPTMGRFLSVDPVIDVEKNLPEPQRWNRYSYVTNNPLKYNDPDGRERLAYWHFNRRPVPDRGFRTELIQTAKTGALIGGMLFGGPMLRAGWQGAVSIVLGSPQASRQLLDAALSPPGSSALPTVSSAKGEIPVGSLAGRCAECAKADLAAISGSTLISGAFGKGTHYAVETTEGVIVDRSLRDNLQAMGAKYDDIPVDKIKFDRKEWEQLLQRVRNTQ